MIFIDRRDAGKKLARALTDYKNDPEAIIIALPRGGVVVGACIAQELHLPLDIVSPRKIGAPHNPEFAIGAITETGHGTFSKEVLETYQISHTYIEKAIEKEKKEAAHRLKIYRGNRPARHLKGKKVIIVDDGVATGSTMFAAIETVKAEQASQIIVAVPVAPPDTLASLQKMVDKVIALYTPANFYAVGQFYQHFDQTSDEEVISLMKENT